MRIVKYKILMLLIMVVGFLLSQENYFEKKEKKISELAEIIIIGKTDSIRITANDSLKKILINTINTPKSYLYKFDKIDHMSILQPKDKRFKIFTWFLPYTNGTYEYFGVIQQCNKRGGECQTYYLDKKINLENRNLNKTLEYNEWYGCLYYDIIENKIKKDRYYTLLGWDGHNQTTTKKIIDVLKIKKKKTPVFGADIFGNKQYRIVLEYSNKYPISLKYDEQLKCIVFDHIEPIDGISKNNFSLYAPTLSYDIFKKTDFGWELEQSIYLNNGK